MTKTYIKGKDRDLESSIEFMREQLKQAGFHIEEVSWQNPTPHIYSVHIRDKDCPLLFSNGKGSTREASLASALGEFVERLCCNEFFSEFYFGKENEAEPFAHYPDEQWIPLTPSQLRTRALDKSLWAFYDPEEILTAGQLIEKNSGLHEQGVCAIPCTRLRDKATILFPINILNNLYVSNGMAAGNTPEEARVQALSEILERYVKNKIIAESLTLPEVPALCMIRYPQLLEIATTIEEEGLLLRIADASLGGTFPVMSVTLINPENGSVFASFGAHPCFETALERAFTELLQGRTLQQLTDLQPPTFDADAVADSFNLENHFINSSGLLAYDFFKATPTYPFVDWDHDTNNVDQFDYLCTLIQDLSFDIYLTEHQFLNIYTCRIIIPGMSEIYPVDDLQWNNSNEGANFRSDLLSLQTLSPEHRSNLLQKLEEGGHNDRQLAADFIGITPDLTSKWASLRIGELKGMLYLAQQDYEQAMEWVNWCLQIEPPDHDYIRFYRCLLALLEIQCDSARDVAEYTKSLEMMYGEATVITSLALIAGSTVFNGLLDPSLELTGFQSHAALSKAYQKLQHAKQSAKPL